MQGNQDYDDDDLFAIEQLLEQDKLSNSLSNQPIIQQNLPNNIIPNTPVTKKTVERVKNNHSEPLKEKPQKQAKLANFFEAPEAKKTVRNQAQSSKKAKTTQKKATAMDTATTGSARMNEYMQAAVEKKEKVDLGKMSISELIKHFSDHQTKITKNSGFDPKTPIDEEKAKIWMYLVSKSFREYQFIMVETCLFYNTLVCLPTGLGKTFVAANVIFNYYRWFPEGKIFFLAPTKPLVHQQRTTVDCIKGIDQDDILELTGSVAAKKRKKYYEEKRIFFMTPQTIDNDLTNGLIDRDKIVLVIFDEAHKALGKYSYSNVAKAIDQANSGYRIVALTATPGNNEDKIQEVLENLNIARLEAKDENDQEVKPYVQSRAVTEVVIKETLAISDVNKMFNDLMMKPIKVINNMNIFPADSKLTFTKPAEVNKLKLVKMLEEFNKNVDEFTMQIGMENRALFYEVVGIISSFCNIKKTLHEQGVQSFLEVLESFKANIKNKYGYQLEYKKRLLDSPDFKKMEEYVKGIKNTGEKHPKLKKLLEILGEFFRNKENIEKQSRVMIFTNNRSSANEICNFLQKDDMIRSSIFIGQGSGKAKSAKTANNEGINQKKQIEILKRFKDYELNTLIATCIGEEGLDIGEIDLIVCYDSGFSPIRLVQRMGRTGRKRAGKVIILLMEGREHMCYKSSVKRSEKLKDGIKANSVSKKASLLKSKANFRFYSFNPRMIPDEITPKLVFADEFQETKAVEALEEVKEEEETEAEAEDIFGDKDTDFTGLETLDEMQMFNQDSKGFGGSEELDDNDNEDDDDIDYDQICEMLDAQADKEKQEKSGNSENTESFPGYMLPEDSMQIGLFVRNSNSTAMNLETSFKSFKSVQSEGNKKTLKRKYYDGEVYEPESGLKHVKLNKSADEQLENSFGKTHSSQET